MSPRKGPKDWSPTGRSYKKKYIVNVKEVHIQRMEIDAISEEDAIKKVAEGDGKQNGDPYYIYTLEPGHWNAEEAP